MCFLFCGFSFYPGSSRVFCARLATPSSSTVLRCTALWARLLTLNQVSEQRSSQIYQVSLEFDYYNLKNCPTSCAFCRFLCYRLLFTKNKSDSEGKKKECGNDVFGNILYSLILPGSLRAGNSEDIYQWLAGRSIHSNISNFLLWACHALGSCT